MTRSRVGPVTRDEWPVYMFRCVCGHWDEDHHPGWCSKCYQLAEARLNATSEELETMAEGHDPEHMFERKSDDFYDRDHIPWHVSVYEVDRLYGGPEEGGWWYNAGRCELTVPVPDTMSDSEIEALVGSLRKAYPKQTGQYGVSSVCYDGGDYEVYVESQRGEDYPKERPHYE